jgi:hypothetical protein
VGERLLLGTLDAAVKEVAGFGDVAGLQVLPGGQGVEGPDARPAPGEVARRRRNAEAAARAARKSRATADRLAEQLASMRARTEELATRHAAAEAGALEAELAAARASEAAEDV